MSLRPASWCFLQYIKLENRKKNQDKNWNTLSYDLKNYSMIETNHKYQFVTEA